ncbi:MAG TPA: FAD-containing oxidoreductase [Hyphomicrobiaceae bacterium]|nr:FAD-containing oxidoreductase [Hyphomicrobiaceae bacterium]
MPAFDAIVIGTGQAGPSLAHRLAAAGMRVAIMERQRFGGTCVNTGCTPTKTLVASAYAARLAHRAGEYGVTISGEISVDMKKAKARKDYVVGFSTRGVERGLRDNPNITVYQGHGRFASPGSIAVGGETLSAPKIFLNVGGRASIPEIPGLDQVAYLTNSSLLDIEVVPQHLIIVGGSYIGLEFAQVFRRFGSKVSVIEVGPRLIGREDADVSAAVADILGREGIARYLGAKHFKLSKRGADIVASLEADGVTTELAGSHLLIAVGRRPNTDDLGLDKAGVATDAKGYISVNDRLETSVPGIWALGDCNGKGAFTHTAYNDGDIVAANLLDGEARGVSDRIVAYNLYTDPPLGRIGMTEAEVRKSGRPALMATMAMEDVSRAFEKGETLGFMKILVDAESRHVLGASILGVGGDEVIHVLLTLMYAKAPYEVMRRAVHIHPTVAELLPTMLGRLKPL